jgi:shikimate kinase
MLIFLIGFMGSGKSYVARNLSIILNCDFVDMDKIIEEEEGLSINELFEQKGENYFRIKEKDYLEKLDINQNLIVSTGGGTPCFFNNMDLMNEKGLTIYLNRSKEIVLFRLVKGQNKRPLLNGLSKDELEKFYDERLSSRETFYKKAKIYAYDKDVNEIASLINRK